MPNAPAARPERDFCASCGFPVRGGRCEACGTALRPEPHSASEESLVLDSHAGAYASPAEADAAGLDDALEAHRAGDVPRFIDLLLAAEAGATARQMPPGERAEGLGWVAVVGGATVFVTLRSAADDLVLEAPIARLTGRQRLPALRLALELSARAAATARVCLRGELLLLRFVARLSPLTPPVLRYYLREIGHLASRYAALLTVGLGAQPAIPDDKRGTATFDVLGRAKKIHLGAGGSLRRSIAPPAHEGSSVPRPAAAAPRPRPLVEPNGGAVSRPVPKPSILPDGAGPTSAAHPPLYAAPRAPEVRVELDERFKRSNTAESGTQPAADGKGRPPAPRAGGDAEAVSSGPQLPPADRLCMLLRHAQGLASRSLEERPATMPWLVRSAVFRAIYDFKDALPDAVAHLYRHTGIGQASAAGAAGAEPALKVIERVIVARAVVQKEKALAIEPMVSASQAKEHVARYLLELDRAPSDAGIRHFLAMGALTELLVRTKLPPQTDQRLRDIVSHAQREGTKTSAIDLMMTALQRINA